uniref:Uncharacterized protein n=2 Tax=Trichobilharzia regenti TaxID=157069 RepID=A0AA85JY36_TRIRE|nr:unnamed protein product [Trichobilharzia regenti]CAH8828887.1 unnamed protein product [Trichobilharzia regenti]
MSSLYPLKWNLLFSLHILVICIAYNFKYVLSQNINGSTSSAKSVDQRIMWISIGFGLSIAILIIIICCLLVLVCNLRSTQTDSESEDFEKPIGNGSGCLPGDRVLATSAQRYHFTHQKQQMLADSKFSDVLERGNSPPKMLYPDLKLEGKLEMENPGFTGPLNISIEKDEKAKT